MPFMHPDEADVFYETTGKGNPPLVFIHGYTCDHTDWDFQVKLFSESHRVVTCDLRGHGQSSGKPATGAIETFGGDIVGLLKALDLRDAVLIGHSMGCRVALETATRAPQLIAGVVFVDGSRMGNGDPREAVAKVRSAMERAGFHEAARRSFAGMFFEGHDAALKNRIIGRALKMDPVYGIDLRSDFPGWDASRMENALSNLKVPLLLIQSTGIGPSGERFSLKAGEITPFLDTVRALVPSARIEVIPGRGHFVMPEAPDATNALIASFVAGIGK